MSKVIQLGIPRSGSTYVWQVLAYLLGQQNVIKTHPGDPEFFELRHLPKIVTIRHPMDVVGSLWAIREQHEKTPKDLHGVIGYARRQFDCLEEWGKLNYIMSYEHNIIKGGVDWQGILQVLGQFKDPAINRIRKAEQIYSLEANRSRSAKMKTFEEVDDLHVHGKHIGAVEPGSWLGILPPWCHEHTYKVMQSCIEKWGYQ